VNLADLLKASELAWRPAHAGAGDLPMLNVSGITIDSRKVGPGFIFVAFDGLRVRGLDHAQSAIDAGAVAVLADRPADLNGAPLLLVDDARAAVGPLASAFHGHPSHDLDVLAVTGTNGKTTTAILVAALLTACGHRAAALGTLGLWTPDGVEPGQLTTPDAVELQATLARLRDAGYRHVCLEASSHALDQRRLDGTRIAAAAWTNLSRDHLDYHGDERAYAAAKARLFRDLMAPGTPAFVNGDDPICATMQSEGLAVAWTSANAAQSTYRAAAIEVGRHGLSFSLAGADAPTLRVKAALPGRHNVDNLIAAILLCRAIGVSDDQIAAGLPTLRPPRGRLEPVANHLGALVLVDYAHTPDALQHALRTGRELVEADGRLFVVFGCGGDRDQGKRPEMGRAAGALADLSIATSDNPRSESPSAIIDQIIVGLRDSGATESRGAAATPASEGGRHWLAIEERGEAIETAIALLGAGDVLLIAGKGHETTQTVGDVGRPLDDVAVASASLAALAAQRPTPATSSIPTGFDFDGQAALQACGGQLVRNGSAGHALSTDSRLVDEETIFVALVGERFDANDFLPAVLSAGAAGAVCSSGRGTAALASSGDAGGWLLEVNDTLVALGDLARAHRRRFAGPVIGITGSNGKTSTKELMALALAPDGPVLATYANHNNRIGVPQTLARLRAKHAVAVVEMGTSEPGEIAELARIVEPDIGVVTSIAEAHLEGLGEVTDVAAEKAALLAALRSDGVAIVPEAEPLLDPHVAELSCRVIRFGTGSEADVGLLGPPAVTGLGQRFTARVLGTRVDVMLPALGVHMIHNSLAALAVAACLGRDLNAAAAALAEFEPVGQRMRPLQVGSRLLLADCYNANPRSTEMALQTLSGLPGPRVAVLGDMLELGPQAAQLHRRVGLAAAAQGIDVLVSLGRHADDYAAGTQAPTHARPVADIDEAVAAVLAATPSGGTVLVKGSRGARMERVIEQLQARVPPGPLEVSSVSLAL